MSEFHPDFVYFNVLRTAQFIKDAAGVPAIVDLDEFRSKFYDQLATSSSSAFWRLVARIESARMRRAEHDVMTKAALILVSSPADLRPDTRAPIRLVRNPHEFGGPLAVEMSETLHREHGRVTKRIVFVGRQSYRANREGILWFATRIFPRVKALEPGCVLQIVGERPPAAIRALASPDIMVTGGVESVEPYYRGACISIAPIRQATGVQMKLVESLALQTPCVVTPTVAVGAGVCDGMECLVADTEDEWFDAVCRLIHDQKLREDLKGHGNLWVDEMHSTPAVEKQFMAALTEAGIVPPGAGGSSDSLASG
ncbi:glycosyltransferase [Microbacterium sp. SYP-A9085]|uniref:glycosyltransferase n=1 Tax=Microbacterium sp. SYP-A9085 TaxID=2664454 RepID=UPI0015620554